ncbi:MAG: ribosomal L7Ae/L30e/S12e/Gadd45 family protein [Clostridia bacterium]|nr:ribosomal L7Ae/L30e/S12e/Gadd45 family protein [Clostridia bacterium]
MTFDGRNVSNVIVGLNSCSKHIARGYDSDDVLFLASDAAAFVYDRVKSICLAHSIEPNETFTKAKLGKLCQIEVDCAVCIVVPNK